MNVFELALWVSVLIGLIRGGLMGKEFGAMGMVIGAVGGLLIALMCYFAALLISAGLGRLSKLREDRPPATLRYILSTVTSFIGVAVMIAPPIATMNILAWLGRWLKD